MLIESQADVLNDLGKKHQTTAEPWGDVWCVVLTCFTFISTIQSVGQRQGVLTKDCTAGRNDIFTFYVYFSESTSFQQWYCNSDCASMLSHIQRRQRKQLCRQPQTHSDNPMSSVSVSVCMCVCVCQQQVTIIKEHNFYFQRGFNHIPNLYPHLSIHSSIQPSIYLLPIYPETGCGGSSVSRETQTSLATVTYSSSSSGIPGAQRPGSSSVS